MPTKIGAGGRQQNYDPRTGRFAKTDYSKLYPPAKPTRKEKAAKREAKRRESLYNRARNSPDPLLFETFCAIEEALPGSVQRVNENVTDPNTNKYRELDIITKRCIIEIKSSPTPDKLQRQYNGQLKYAESKNKKLVVFAPNILPNALRNHLEHGLAICNNFKSLLNFIKENEK